MENLCDINEHKIVEINIRLNNLKPKIENKLMILEEDADAINIYNNLF